jgi:hypothetical protein
MKCDHKGGCHWTPPDRCINTGHRVTYQEGYDVVATHKLNWRWWLAEYPMRWLARRMRTADIRNKRGTEVIPNKS